MEFVSHNVHWLLPEEPSPCDIFIHFRGQYALAVGSGQAVTFKLLEKLAKSYCSRIYVRQPDQATWQRWAAARYPTVLPADLPGKGKNEESGQKALYGNKRAELLSYVQKTAQKRMEGDPLLDGAISGALALLQKVIQQPTLDWYFRQFHEPPDLFQHNARVALWTTAFLQLVGGALHSSDELEAICYSALIHELSGEITENVKTTVSLQTLATLEKNQHPVPKNVIDLITLHDELCSGKGFPNNRRKDEIPAVVRAFTLFNHFDSYRLQIKGTRRARFEKTKDMMQARQLDYDAALWPLFWHFWEKQVEAIT